MTNPENSQSNPYDPSEHTADEVREHLKTVEDEEEFDRIQEEEAAGKNRSTVLSVEFGNGSEEEAATEEEEEIPEGGEVEEGYDARLDPLVPSSSLAEHVNRELRVGDSSPTLAALREGAKEEE